MNEPGDGLDLARGCAVAIAAALLLWTIIVAIVLVLVR